MSILRNVVDCSVGDTLQDQGCKYVLHLLLGLRRFLYSL
jgi:hypothetical protein